MKKLGTQIRKLEKNLKEAKLEMAKKKELWDLARAEKVRIENQILSFKNRNNLSVSDHALVRYLERVAQIDVESMKKAIVDIIQPCVSEYGDGEYSIGELKAVVVNSVVVTIINKK